MSPDAAARPPVEVVGDGGDGYCDPESGACVLPTASESLDTDQPSQTADAH